MSRITQSLVAALFMLQSNLLQASPCDISLDAKCAAFFPLDSKVRKIYGSALPMVTLEANARLCPLWEAWLDSSYVFADGKSYGWYGKDTHLSFVPISLGVKYFYSLCDGTDLYVGAGPCYSFFTTKDHNSLVHKITSKKQWGAVFKSGFRYHQSDCTFVEGFFNYMYQELSFGKTSDDPFVYRHDANLSSLQLGVAIGRNF